MVSEIYDHIPFPQSRSTCVGIGRSPRGRKTEPGGMQSGRHLRAFVHRFRPIWCWAVQGPWCRGVGVAVLWWFSLRARAATVSEMFIWTCRRDLRSPFTISLTYSIYHPLWLYAARGNISSMIWAATIRPIGPAKNNNNNKTCWTSKDSNQDVHSPSMARVLVYPYLDSPDAVEDICDQRRL